MQQFQNLVSPEGDADSIETVQLCAVDHCGKVPLLSRPASPQATQPCGAILKAVPCERLQQSQAHQDSSFLGFQRINPAELSCQPTGTSHGVPSSHPTSCKHLQHLTDTW